MFGSLGVPEILLIFIVILIVFGPRKIPEIGQMLGKALGEFRKATDDLKHTIEREVRLEELKSVGPSIMAPLESISRSEPGTGSSEFLGVPRGSSEETAAATETTANPPEEPRGTPRNPEVLSSDPEEPS
ncbi:MAG TPA: twin-arginine translocase TatA/TatE family subunit [Thermoanaerobaculia bacterium]|nr:twin-arginine translocase TatA/TatE family subunit [Thermoanaerobaculia bacterium]